MSIIEIHLQYQSEDVAFENDMNCIFSINDINTRFFLEARQQLQIIVFNPLHRHSSMRTIYTIS